MLWRPKRTGASSDFVYNTLVKRGEILESRCEEQSAGLNVSSSVIQIMRVIVRVDRACNSQAVIVVRNSSSREFP